ncbi:MAG: NYN domain-containing protein [Burkholderiaceae bacterium]|jgi:uncharacterized protein (TIGR00288 family)|nr:NYN domain-containing protein [Burkholderiaceae bacterium]
MKNTMEETRAAVLIDCDNVPPEILEYALRIAAQFGRIVVRRGYGNLGTLSAKWREAMVRQAFSPSLHYQYAPGKNTSDIAMALDAQEILFDERVDSFCLVTSDSDFTYLCRKLRERGAMVYIIGEDKTSNALRNACDQFFEWKPETEVSPKESTEPQEKTTGKSTTASAKGAKTPPHIVIEAIWQLVSDPASEGAVNLGTLGQYLKRIDSGFSPKKYGHASLLNMLKTSSLLTIKQVNSTHMVELGEKAKKYFASAAAQETASK